jgi:hypothetical protein
MSRVFARLVWAGLATLAATLPLSADPDCAACRVADEVQAGDFHPSDDPAPPPVSAEDLKGKRIDLPLPGSPTVIHRSGAGVYLGEVGKGNNVYVDGDQKSVTLGVRRDF